MYTICFTLVSTNICEGRVALKDEAKRLMKFAELSSLEKKMILDNRLSTIVDELFPEEETIEEQMIVDLQRSIINHGKHEYLGF